MSDSGTLDDRQNQIAAKTLHFDVSTGLKRVLGRELITTDDVAIFEMVKNSFDANASVVRLYFDDDEIVITDDGDGMSFEDLRDKWLFVAYSEKREQEEKRGQKDFRDIATDRHLAGSKGIGRFSSDRLGRELILQTRSKLEKSAPIHRLKVDWSRFDKNSKQHFDDITVDYSEGDSFELPAGLRKYNSSLVHGTTIRISKLRDKWRRPALVSLKGSLAKLINPFGYEVDGFRIFIHAPEEEAEDKRVRAAALKDGEEPASNAIINGVVGNNIFSVLRGKTTFIDVTINGDKIETTLIDRGEVVYKIREPNPYSHLAGSGFKCEIYYLNQSARATFTRRIGLPSVEFGSVFLFRNNFRVYPIGDEGNDWFAFDRRKQQGYARFLGTREIIGRVDVFGSDKDFQEASSRNQGLIDTPAVRQLKKAVMEHCLKRLEKYVVPVSWPDKGDASSDDLSRVLTDPGRARVSNAVAGLVDDDQIELLSFSKRLIGLLNERSSEFESSLVALRSIASKVGDKALLAKIDRAEERFEQLKQSEQEAQKIADKERKVAQAALERASAAEAETVREKRRSHFLESVVNVDSSTILNLHHQITIYSVQIAQKIQNLLRRTAAQQSIPRDVLLQEMEQIAFLNAKVQSITRFAPLATFKLDSEMIETDLPEFIEDYLDKIAKTGTQRVRMEVENDHPGMKKRFNPIDIAVIVENLVSNSWRAHARKMTFKITRPAKNILEMRVSDNGDGFVRGLDKDRIFEMGYTSTRAGSGLGLYHIRQVLGEMGGSIELVDAKGGKGVTFLIKIVGEKKSQ
jgi:signal transduction histidine kinase